MARNRTGGGVMGTDGNGSPRYTHSARRSELRRKRSQAFPVVVKVTTNRPPERQSVSPRNDAREPTDAPLTSDDAVYTVQDGDPTDPRSTGGQARGYSWAPFEKGHTLSLVHGADSARA